MKKFERAAAPLGDARRPAPQFSVSGITTGFDSTLKKAQKENLDTWSLLHSEEWLQ